MQEKYFFIKHSTLSIYSSDFAAQDVPVTVIHIPVVGIIRFRLVYFVFILVHFIALAHILLMMLLIILNIAFLVHLILLSFYIFRFTYNLGIEG